MCGKRPTSSPNHSERFAIPGCGDAITTATRRAQHGRSLDFAEGAAQFDAPERVWVAEPRRSHFSTRPAERALGRSWLGPEGWRVIRMPGGSLPPTCWHVALDGSKPCSFLNLSSRFCARCSMVVGSIDSIIPCLLSANSQDRHMQNCWPSPPVRSDSPPTMAICSHSIIPGLALGQPLARTQQPPTHLHEGGECFRRRAWHCGRIWETARPLTFLAHLGEAPRTESRSSGASSKWRDPHPRRSDAVVHGLRALAHVSARITDSRFRRARLAKRHSGLRHCGTPTRRAAMMSLCESG